jgi:gas vesicle structural protein
MLMARRRVSPTPAAQALTGNLTLARRVLEPPDATLVDVLDQLLNKGVMLTGDITMGVAGIDLIYLRLSSVLCAADRVMGSETSARRKPSRHRRPSGGRRS